MGYFFRTTQYALGKLCRQLWLLAGLALLCLLAPGLLGRAAEAAFSSGVEFGGISLALTVGEEDEALALAEGLLNSMEDMSRYVTFLAMEKDAAMAALDRGEVTAVLYVPWSLVKGILSGENPDIVVYINEDQPLEGLLLYWVGQSAADLLSAVQAGIYAVADSWDTGPPEGLSRGDMIQQINLVYIRWTLGRQSLFETVPLSAVGTMQVSEHYQLSLLAWLAMSLAPVFCAILEPERLAARRRLRTLGRGAGVCFLGDLTACCLVLFGLLLGPMVLLGCGVVTAAVYALVCGSFGCLCCLITGDSARCGALSFLSALCFLALAGGIVPPLMLPNTLRQLQSLSPITWLRQLAGIPLGYPCPKTALLLIPTTAALLLLSKKLYERHMEGKE